MRIRFRNIKLKSRIYEHPELAALAGLIVAFVCFAILAPHFATLDSLAATLTSVVHLGITSIGITFLMVSGEFDLSVGSTFALSTMILVLLSKIGINQVLALLVALSAAVVVGFMNGIVVVKTGLPSFIVTLGSMMFWRGLLFAITGGFAITYHRYTPFMFILNGKFARDFRMGIIWFVILAVIFDTVLRKTRYGNWTFATGGSKAAAEALGVKVNRVKLINFVIAALLAGLAGCIEFARFRSIDPARGSGLELEAIAASVIGGSLMSGGYGSIIGSSLGALLIGVVRSGLISVGAPAYWYQAFIGVILVVAAIINAKVRGAILEGAQ